MLVYVSLSTLWSVVRGKLETYILHVFLRATFNLGEFGYCRYGDDRVEICQKFRIATAVGLRVLTKIRPHSLQAHTQRLRGVNGTLLLWK